MRLTNLQREILAYVAKHGSANEWQICRDTGRTFGGLEQTANSLRLHGLLIKHLGRPNRYEITEAGRKAAS